MNGFSTHTRLGLPRLVLAASLAAIATVAAAQDKAPQIMQVPADNRIVWQAPAEGAITYECRLTQTDGARYAWIIAGAAATLGAGQSGQTGTYKSPPETWRAADGSTLTGMETVRANAGPDRLYDQLVLANPSSGVGVLTGVTYIQRFVRAGGGVPQSSCSAANKGHREQVKYQADYVFWKPN
ncbi:DUF3455 domain-containing protein [Achromobacter sp.]|uniref:DUF3455 domain-containing protein n=1 Tax=Achromobacter sp. TaxID=134375 RepID=UPI0028AD299A|nr:DUF3455 domain-containing protein [Achromobacter sp.]